MKTQSASLFTKSLLVLGIFGVSAITTYGAISNGGLLKSTPYQERSATADAKFSQLTNGSGPAILDTVIAKIKAKATTKAGNPLDTTKYNAYLDDRLTAIDAMDDQVRAQYGADYTFLFQYFYPRVAELKKNDDATTRILQKIGSVFGGDEETTATTSVVAGTNQTAVATTTATTTTTTTTTNPCGSGKKKLGSVCVTDTATVNPTGNYTVGKGACATHL